MSKARMQAAKELIQSKQYDEARAILKTVDHPTAREWEKKLDQIAPKKTKLTQSNNKVFIAIASIVGVLLVAIIVLLLARPRPTETIAAALPTEMPAADATVASAQATLSWISTAQAIDVMSSLEVYCESLTDKSQGACDRWSHEVIQAKYDEAKGCYDEYDWISDRQRFSGCILLIGGIAVLGDNAIVPTVDIESWGDPDYQVIGRLSAYCGDDLHGDDYCYVWSIMTYVNQKAITTGCYQDTEGKGLTILDTFTCFKNQGIDSNTV